VQQQNQALLTAAAAAAAATATAATSETSAAVAAVASPFRQTGFPVPKLNTCRQD